MGVSGLERVAGHERSCQMVEAANGARSPKQESSVCLSKRSSLRRGGFDQEVDPAPRRSAADDLGVCAYTSTLCSPPLCSPVHSSPAESLTGRTTRLDRTRPTHPAGTFAQALTALRAHRVDGAKAGRERACLADAVSILRCRRTVLVRCRRGDELRTGMERRCGGFCGVRLSRALLRRCCRCCRCSAGSLRDRTGRVSRAGLSRRNGGLKWLANQ
jgi:hypothetical protein